MGAALKGRQAEKEEPRPACLIGFVAIAGDPSRGANAFMPPSLSSAGPCSRRGDPPPVVILWGRYELAANELDRRRRTVDCLKYRNEIDNRITHRKLRLPPFRPERDMMDKT